MDDAITRRQNVVATSMTAMSAVAAVVLWKLPLDSETKTKWIVLVVASAMSVYFGYMAMRKTLIPKVDDKGMFGDQMAPEGEVSNISTIKIPMYSLLMAFAAFVSLILKCGLWTIPAYYAVGLTAFYVWHRLAHSTHGEMYRIHMIHHQKSFPKDDFYGDRSGAVKRLYGDETPSMLRLMTPKNSMTGTLAHEGPLYILFVAILVIGKLFGGTSWAALGALTLLFLVMAMVGGALHISYHVRGFEFERFRWYRELRSLHYIHHIERKNFAMVNTMVDLVFGSLQYTR